LLPGKIQTTVRIAEGLEPRPVYSPITPHRGRKEQPVTARGADIVDTINSRDPM
jgi:hypothetical protein